MPPPLSPDCSRTSRHAARLAFAGFVLGLAVSATATAIPFAGSPFGPAVAASFQDRDESDRSKNNRLAIVSHGYEALLLRVHLIRQAKTTIAIQTFIWTNDECGRLVAHELLNAARRGVRVRVIVDHMFSDQDPDTVAFLATANPNFELKHYRPAMSRMKPSFFHRLAAGLSSFRDANQRMHNKVMIFDDAIVLTGGRNIENTYFDHSIAMNFRDRDVLAVGPVAGAAAEAFEEFWCYRDAVSSRDLPDVNAAIARGSFERYATRADFRFGPHFVALEQEANDPALMTSRFVARLNPVRKVAFVTDKPGKPRTGSTTAATIAGEVNATLERAKKSVVIQTPYLVLSDETRELFRTMQNNNPALRIQISTNSLASTDNFLAYSGNYRLRHQYVEDLNLRVHEFKPQPGSLPTLFPRHALMTELAKAQPAEQQGRVPFLCLHAKSFVVDDAIAFVGSHNFDPRSENFNTEVGLLVEDDDFARALRTEIEDDMRSENSWVIARRALPLGLDVVNRLLADLLSITPVDLWPIQNTSSFELRPGGTPVLPDHPSFFENYRSVGLFPETEVLSQKLILTHLCKMIGAPLTPVL